ncbi:MAG TPA: ATP-binding protein, partial [Candidatus Solibacter sp.]|nr:ATP-binding protein [Candidatus Solibacter sp.]
LVCTLAAALLGVIAWADSQIPTASIGFLYLIPVLLSAAALNTIEILVMAALCGFLQEAFSPGKWGPGASDRLLVATAAFSMAGFFVTQLNKRRRLLAAHLEEREEQMRLRREAEMQVRVLIETSPLAILTIGRTGCVELANVSACQLLAFEDGGLPGQDIQPYLPTLYRLLKTHRTAASLRTNVECKGVRRNGEVFLAHVWLSTYSIGGGPGLAAVVWDSSENLRDREGAGFHSMMETSRVLVGAMSHEIRNLASAAAAAHGELAAHAGVADNDEYHALGTLIRGLEQIASSGLQAAAGREIGTADLGTVFDEARIVIEPSLREAGISVVWEIGENLPLVQADHHSLLRVLLNLARNSRQALESAPVKEVRISTAVESDLVLVRFRDSGPGVAHPEDLFRPFQAGAHSFGLGLYVSRAILRSQGGGLRYEPQTGGSCFTVELWPVENAVEG